MDLALIAHSLAAQLGTVTANGETVTATELLPNTVGKLSLLIYPPTGTLEVGMSRRRNDVYSFPVRLLRDPLSVPERSAALYAWATALRDLVEANLDLGLPGMVAQAHPVHMRLELGGQPYGDQLYDLVELTVEVQVYEIVTTVHA